MDDFWAREQAKIEAAISADNQELALGGILEMLVRTQRNLERIAEAVEKMARGAA